MHVKKVAINDTIIDCVRACNAIVGKERRLHIRVDARARRVACIGRGD